MTPTFQGEVQFVTFADSSKSGPRITLRLSEREELDSFLGMEGKRFMAVLVQIGDDEQPIPPTPSKPFARTPSTGPICQWLVMRCKEREFQEWAASEAVGCFTFGPGEGEARASDWVRGICGVKSRSDIDGDPKATHYFEESIRKPYLAHTRQAA